MSELLQRATLALLLIATLACVPLVVAEEQAARFDVLEFTVEGNTVLPVKAVERAVYPFLGPAKTIDDVESARAALERAYREAGYQTVSVQIPEQRVDEGVVVLRVLEGTVGQVRVKGTRYYSQGQILDKVTSLEPGTVPSFPQVQKDLAALNTTATRRVVPVLRPGKNIGTTDVDLNVEDRLPLQAGVELNNQQSPDTDPLRLVLDARYDNLWQREHSIGVQFQVSPQDTQQVRALALSYFAPLFSATSYLAGYYVASNSSVASVGGINVLGEGQIFGLRWIKPLPAPPELSQSLILGADYKDLQDSVVQPGLPALETPIQYVPLSASYTLNRQGARSTTALMAGLSLGLRGLVNDDDEFVTKRFMSSGNFVVFKWNADRTQRLNQDLSLYGRFTGQVADQPLIPNEQFAAGGVATVRGYLESEQLGDDAVNASVELRLVSLAPRLGIPLGTADLYVFADGAQLWILDPLPGQQSSVGLLSAGVGMSLSGFNGLSLRLDLAYPFKTTSFTEAGDVRLLFAAAYRYTGK